MSIRSASTVLILLAFALAALFGIYGMVSLSHAEHGGCPTFPGPHSLCTTALEHLGHWQTVFTAVFAKVLVLVALAALALGGTLCVSSSLLRSVAWRQRRRVRHRPTVWQELFSRGIVHRKEPHLAC